MNTGVRQFKKNAVGSALILTIFIMAGMLLAAMGGAYVSLLGIRASGLQADSTKAYYAAEAGSEELLYRLPTLQDVYQDKTAPFELFASSTPLEYNVFFYPNSIGGTTLVFRSIGNFNKTRRSVEMRFGEN